MELLASALIGSGWLRGLSFNQARQKAVEFDLLHSMTAVPTTGPEVNIHAGTIRAIRPNTPGVGQTTVILDLTAWTVQRNELENGKLQIAGDPNAHKIIGNLLGQPTVFPTRFRHLHGSHQRKWTQGHQ